MSSHPATTSVIKEGTSEAPFLLFTGNRRQSGTPSLGREFFTDIFVPLIVGIAAAVLFLLLYAFFKGRPG
ncbi:hypothetical protein [Granulicella sp. S190]|uniref:hypothetical protein n=1 Tax=Granulicella sp. S190 TaxID=1747226 RepID=UPI00131C63C8|nr:hypothetical protein [Granulicella sp. S190]